jgi:hypothetical protein
MTRIVNVTVGKPRRDEHGRDGVAVHLHIEEGGWDGHYSFTTHGMPAAAVAVEKDRLLARHGRKAAKLTDLSSLVGRHLPAGWTITDATVRDRGHGCELLCRAKSVSGERVEWAEFFDDPEHLPNAAAVLDEMRARIGAVVEGRIAGDQHVREIRAVLGLALE